MIDSSAKIHRLALVENASVGARTRVWQFASVIRNARVGADCKIAANAIVDGSVVGDGSIISHAAFVDPGISIGKGVFIGPHVSLCNDFWPRVGKDGWFNVDDLTRGDVVVTRIEDGASIGANAVILPGLRVGVDVMIAAGAVVTKDVPAAHLWRRDGSVVPIVKTPNRMRTLAAA